ncbi:hypothetical protein [Streptosporangium subroseum]|nr:hypothetical protein [Streptosporangium subroseum]
MIRRAISYGQRPGRVFTVWSSWTSGRGAGVSDPAVAEVKRHAVCVWVEYGYSEASRSVVVTSR